MYQMVISPCHQRYTYTRFSSPTPFHKFIPRDRKIEPSPFSNSWPLIGISLDARSIDIFLFFYEFCLINFINFIIFLLSDIAFQFRKRAAFYHGVDGASFRQLDNKSSLLNFKRINCFSPRKGGNCTATREIYPSFISLFIYKKNKVYSQSNVPELL